jgi:DNA-binding transcriptional LysR family regulator
MLGSIELFCLTADLESFTAAAASAGLTPAAVSRSISRLEARLGVRLFTRTTRRVRLSDAGRAYFAQCKQAVAQLLEAERAITGEQRVPAGTVRMSMPTSYGHFRILPLLGEFRELFPAVNLEIQLSNRNVDLIADGYDLAVRGRVPPESGLVARTLENAGLVVVSASQYLQKKGVPKAVEDLQHHDCIQFLLPRTGQAVPWLFHQEGREIEVHTNSGIQCADDILAPVTLALHAAGLAQTYRFMVEADLAQGRLVEVLTEFSGASRPFSLLYPANRHMPQRVRVLVDFLTQRLSMAH